MKKQLVMSQCPATSTRTQKRLENCDEPMRCFRMQPYQFDDRHDIDIGGLEHKGDRRRDLFAALRKYAIQ
jgi:hypothetical protein